VVQKALGQDNIDDLLRLSEDYKKSESLSMSSFGAPSDEVPAEMEMIVAARPPPPRPLPVEHVVEERREVFMTPANPPPPPVLIRNPPPPQAVEFVNTGTLVRDVSPSRSSTTTMSRGPVIVDARPPGISQEVALIEHDHHHHHHRRHRSRSHGRELVAAERLSNGELILYEEKIERIEAPRRGVRIEKDKKGRMSISVPKYR